MADGLEIKVDARSALARFSPSGIPEAVRRNLRRAIPGLMRDLTGRIDANLGALKSREHLQIKGGPQGVMIENAQNIVGRAEMGWTGDERAKMVPQVIETGAKPHVITARNVSVLSFFWPVIGKQAFFRSVNHPGYPGIHYMERAFQSMQREIVDKLTQAVRDGTKQ